MRILVESMNCASFLTPATAAWYRGLMTSLACAVLVAISTTCWGQERAATLQQVEKLLDSIPMCGTGLPDNWHDEFDRENKWMERAVLKFAADAYDDLVSGRLSRSKRDLPTLERLVRMDMAVSLLTGWRTPGLLRLLRMAHVLEVDDGHPDLSTDSWDGCFSSLNGAIMMLGEKDAPLGSRELLLSLSNTARSARVRQWATRELAPPESRGRMRR